MSASASVSSSRSNGASSIRRARSRRSSSRQQRPQRVAAMQLVGAVAEQQQHPLLAQAARQERDERPRRAIGPVHVLEDRARAGSTRPGGRAARASPRTAAAGPTGRRRSSVAAARRPGPAGSSPAGRGARRQLLERLVAPADQRAQRAQQRRVRQVAVGLLDALAAQDSDAWCRPGRRSELADQPRVLPTPESPPSSTRPAGPLRPPATPVGAQRARRPARRSGCWSASNACPKYRAKSERDRRRRRE